MGMDSIGEWVDMGCNFKGWVILIRIPTVMGGTGRHSYRMSNIGQDFCGNGRLGNGVILVIIPMGLGDIDQNSYGNGC